MFKYICPLIEEIRRLSTERNLLATKVKTITIETITIETITIETITNVLEKTENDAKLKVTFSQLECKNVDLNRIISTHESSDELLLEVNCILRTISDLTPEREPKEISLKLGNVFIDIINDTYNIWNKKTQRIKMTKTEIIGVMTYLNDLYTI